MNQDYYFPLFGLFATAGKIFLLSEGGEGQSDKAEPEKYARQRERKIFACHLRQYAGIGRIGAAGYLCGKFCSVGRTAADLGLMGIR